MICNLFAVSCSTHPLALNTRYGGRWWYISIRKIPHPMNRSRSLESPSKKYGANAAPTGVEKWHRKMVGISPCRHLSPVVIIVDQLKTSGKRFRGAVYPVHGYDALTYIKHNSHPRLVFVRRDERREIQLQCQQRAAPARLAVLAKYGNYFLRVCVRRRIFCSVFVHLLEPVVDAGVDKNKLSW